jgi:lipopolysaccharide export LptBFGC system permease protein LptF
VRILTRYILGEILSLTLIGCALFTFILFMPQLPHILEVVVRNSSTLTDVAQVFLFTLPNLFKVTIPMAVLWGILSALAGWRQTARSLRCARRGWASATSCA